MPKWLKSTQYLKFEVADAVATITLNRPEKRNALLPDTTRELREAMLEADDRTDVNVIVLQGAGKDFCAGYDLADVYGARKAEEDSEEPLSYRSQVGTFDDDCWGLERTQQEIMTIFEVHKPVIAKVQGNCVAGGTDVALMCDIIIAADDARIGFPATRANGSPPNHMWLYHVGPQWAKRLLLSGDVISGKDAAKIGLVLDSVPADRLDEEVTLLAQRIAAVDSELLATQKRIVNLGLEMMGWYSMQRLAAEMDARGHLSKGARRTQFKKDIVEFGLKEALANRDAPFGDGVVRVNR